MNNEPEVLDDIDMEPELSDGGSRPGAETHSSSSDEVTEDELGDTQLGQHLGRLITEIRRDERTFQQGSDPGAPADDLPAPDPFNPSEFSLDTSLDAPASDSSPSSSAGQGPEEDPASGQVRESGGADDDDSAAAIGQLVAEIENALQRFTQAERLRADQLIAEKEAQVSEQYRRLRNLANKVAKQKAQIQEAKKELKAKLELADRLHIEFDGIRQVLNGKLGILDQLESEDEPTG